MTLDQLIDLYEQKFGDIPLEIISGLSDDRVAEILTEALETGKEVLFKLGVLY